MYLSIRFFGQEDLISCTMENSWEIIAKILYIMILHEKNLLFIFLTSLFHNKYHRELEPFSRLWLIKGRLLNHSVKAIEGSKCLVVKTCTRVMQESCLKGTSVTALHYGEGYILPVCKSSYINIKGLGPQAVSLTRSCPVRS